MTGKNLSWWIRWSRIIGGFTFAQACVQFINAVSGVLLVRFMSKEDYAWFTIVSALLATISVLTDSGLGSALTSIGGPLCQDPPRFAELMALTRRMRRTFMTVAACLALPPGLYLLHNHGASPWTCALLGLAILASAIPAAEIAMLSSVNRLHMRLRQIVQADATAGGTRLVAIVMASLAGLNAVLASGITAVSQWLQLCLLRFQTRDLASVPHEQTGSLREPMLRVVRHMLPIAIFQCIQGQIATWVLSLFASSGTVADVGALSRLGIIMTLLFIPLQNIAFPMIARATEPGRLRRLSAMILLASVAVTVLLVVAGLTCSRPVLWVLGPQYAHLRIEFAWYLGYIALGFLAHAVWNIALTRSWVRRAWVHIPATIIVQAAGARWLDLSGAVGAIQFAALSHVVGLAISSCLVWRGLAKAGNDMPPAPATQ